MTGWPKTIYVKGIGIPVESWEEMDELMERYGASGQIVIHQQDAGGADPKKQRGGHGATMSPTDRSLLQQFVEAEDRGVAMRNIGPVLGKQGKAIRRGLDIWGRKIGLMPSEGASAFAPSKSTYGRGYRLVDAYLQAARHLLGS